MTSCSEPPPRPRPAAYECGRTRMSWRSPSLRRCARSGLGPGLSLIVTPISVTVKGSGLNWAWLVVTWNARITEERAAITHGELPELLTLEESTTRIGISVRNVRLDLQGAGAAAGTPRPVGLLRHRPRRASRAGPGAAGPRPSPWPRIEKYLADLVYATPRTSPRTARCWHRGRPTSRPRSCSRLQCGLGAARRGRPGDLLRARHRGAQPARRDQASSSSAQRRARPARPRLPDRGSDRRRRRVRRARAGAARQPDQLSARWRPVYKEAGTSPEKIEEVVERLKPLLIASLATAYEDGHGRPQARADRRARRLALVRRMMMEDGGQNGGPARAAAASEVSERLGSALVLVVEGQRQGRPGRPVEWPRPGPGADLRLVGRLRPRRPGTSSRPGRSLEDEGHAAGPVRRLLWRRRGQHQRRAQYRPLAWRPSRRAPPIRRNDPEPAPGTSCGQHPVRDRRGAPVVGPVRHTLIRAAGRRRCSRCSEGGPITTSPTAPVTGATGFVGARLVPALVESGHRVKVMTRHPDTDDGPGEAVFGDVHDPGTLGPALEGVDVAIYLVHSLDDDDFERKDAAARVFGLAAAASGTRQLRHLGGLGLEDEALSLAPAPRREVEDLLGEAGVPVTALRAAIVVGRGISWEMTLAPGQEPAGDGRAAVGGHADPADRDRRRGALPRRRRGQRGGVRRVLQIGGADQLDGPADAAGGGARDAGGCRSSRPRWTPCSSWWITLVTGVDITTAANLIESMGNRVARPTRDPRDRAGRADVVRRGGAPGARGRAISG